MVEEIKSDIFSFRNDESAVARKKYFKHLEPGDVFIGVSCPIVQKIISKYHAGSKLVDIAALLTESVHEYRFAALLLLVKKYEKTKDPFLRKEILDLYLANLQYVNNWDLVDCSCYKILGHYAFHYKQDQLLMDLSDDENLWKMRVGIVSLLYYIKKKDHVLVPQILANKLNHPHDLINKAVGWMLKESWNRGGQEMVEELIRDNLPLINRTTLRIAIEKMPTAERKAFMAKT